MNWNKIGAIGNIALVVLNLVNLIINLTRWKMKKKVKVKLIKTNKDFDLSEVMDKLSTVEELTKMRVSSLNKAVQDFEKWLIERAIDSKLQRLYVIRYTMYNVENISLDFCYCVYGTKEAAERHKEELLKCGGTSSTICEYDFGKLLNMSDNEFESLPDLGGKDLARKYRKVMREAQKQKFTKIH